MRGTLKDAIKISKKSHKDKKDKIGKPQFDHPSRVMDNVDELNEKKVAIMHDVLEDTSTTLKDLRKCGFDDEILEAVDAISRREGEHYFDYISRVSNNELATKVKIADLIDNMHWDYPTPEEKDGLMKRYRKALRILTEVEDKHWRYD
jgi:(p)ppGpp synthase/HD superfamily hydrolase